MQVGSWPSGDWQEPAVGSMWPRSPLILGSEQLHQVWFGFSFQPQTSFPSPASPPPPPRPDVVTETLLYQPQRPPTTRKGGLISRPPSPTIPAGLEPSREYGPPLLGWLRSSNQTLISMNGVGW